MATGQAPVSLGWQKKTRGSYRCVLCVLCIVDYSVVGTGRRGGLMATLEYYYFHEAALVFEFDSHRGEISLHLQKYKKGISC